MKNIHIELEHNKKFGNTIEIEMLNNLVSDNNTELMVFTAYLQNALSHFCAMNILIEKGLYNSAFALVRVFFDTIVRGHYAV